MKRSFFVMLMLFVFVVTGSAMAQEAEGTEKPKSAPMKMYHIVMAQKGPNWKSQNSEEGMDARMRVIEGLREGARQGVVISAGLVNDETNVEFIIILDVETKTEAYNLINAGKLVKNGFFTPLIYSYFAPDGLTVKASDIPKQ
jgi:hypothetical protein